MTVSEFHPEGINPKYVERGIDDKIKIIILKVRGNSIRIGIEAPREIPDIREELISVQRTTVA